jgi:EAL domain-containing protein (putative c-di-GMP-specific phosphodiesterase class I)
MDQDVPLVSVSRGSVELSADLIRGLLDGGGLATAYQPIINVRRNVVCGWEALLRAHHDELGAVEPVALLTAAEKHGLLDAVTRRVVEDAWETVSLATDVVDEPLQVSINLELSQFRADSELINWLASIEWPEQVTVIIELTERGGDEWTRAHEYAAVLLEARGLRLAIDDYGAGSARMGFLHRRAWDVVKMDRQMVGGFGQREQVVVRRFVEMLAELGTSSLIEGVETPEQLAAVRELGVDYVQGYLLGMPVPGPVMLAGLRRRGLAVEMGGPGLA